MAEGRTTPSFFEIQAMNRGTEVGHWIQHIALCYTANGCVCSAKAPGYIDGVTLLMCQKVVITLRDEFGLIPINAECILDDGRRPDLVLLNPLDGTILIVELKCGNVNIMTHFPSTTIKNRRTMHMAQLCHYAVTWNGSELFNTVGPCTMVLLHYPDSKDQTWLSIDPGLWDEYAEIDKAKTKKKKTAGEDFQGETEENARALAAEIQALSEQQRTERQERSQRRSARGGRGRGENTHGESSTSNAQSSAAPRGRREVHSEAAVSHSALLRQVLRDDDARDGY